MTGPEDGASEASTKRAEPRRAGRRRLARVGLVLFGIALGLGIGEVALRVLGFEEEMARRSTRFDPRYGTVREDSWVFGFDIEPADGVADLRGQRVPLEKPEAETRVLFVGDSGTEGVRLPLSGTFPARFERRMHEAGHGSVRAVNAGVFGMTTLDELHFLESELLPLEPDVVVLGLFLANDLNFNLGHTERLHEVHPPSSWGKTLVRNSALAHFVYVQALALNARHGWWRAESLAEERFIPRELALVDAHGFHMLSYPAGEVATYVEPPSNLIAHAYDVLEQALWRFQRLGAQHGFSFRVLLVPTPSQIAGELTLLHYPDIEDDLRRAGIDVDALPLDFDAPTRRVLAVCEALAIPCFDPSDRMREIGMDVFFPDDEHPTATGHAVLAEELAAHRETLLEGP